MFIPHPSRTRSRSAPLRRCQAFQATRLTCGGAVNCTPCSILDIFEGTQQIQQLVVARRELELTSAQLK